MCSRTVLEARSPEPRFWPGRLLLEVLTEFVASVPYLLLAAGSLWHPLPCRLITPVSTSSFLWPSLRVSLRVFYTSPLLQESLALDLEPIPTQDNLLLRSLAQLYLQRPSVAKKATCTRFWVDISLGEVTMNLQKKGIPNWKGDWFWDLVLSLSINTFIHFITLSILPPLPVFFFL